MVYQMLKGKVASCFLFLFQVVPGETALAFYTARNPTDKPVTGISSYNVVPFDAGQYFNKIQCFCFEEQILNPNEQVRISDTVTSFFPAWNRVLYTASVYFLCIL